MKLFVRTGWMSVLLMMPLQAEEGISFMAQLHELTDARWKTGEWERNHEMYITYHKAYVVEVLDDEKVLHRDHFPRIRYRQQVKVIQVLRGEEKEEMMVGYSINKGEAPLKKGEKMIIVGTSNTIGINVIAAWMATDDLQNLLVVAMGLSPDKMAKTTTASSTP